MRFRRTVTLGVAAVTAVSLDAAAVVGGTAAGASARAGIPTKIVRMIGGHVVLDGGDTLHAGRIQFKIVTGKGSHTLQIARLHHGYTLQDAGHDFGLVNHGDTDAIGRIDDNITFRGGATARPGKPGWCTVTLRRGHFQFLDFSGNGRTEVTVVGDVPHRPGVSHQSKITAFSYGFESEPETIPASGTVYFLNQADQPHFLSMERVKEGTTPAQVRRFVKSGGNYEPSWGLEANTGSSTVSPTFGEMMRYDLPAGEYLIACFWPDRFSGMPHFFMGMWKLIHLA